jgi:hypothetical protein
MYRTIRVFLLLLALLPASSALAQESQMAASVPTSFRLDNFNFEYQGWNNCGPATLTTTLTYFGYSDDQ